MKSIGLKVVFFILNFFDWLLKMARFELSVVVVGLVPVIDLLDFIVPVLGIVMEMINSASSKLITLCKSFFGITLGGNDCDFRSFISAINDGSSSVLISHVVSNSSGSLNLAHSVDSMLS